MNTLESAWGYAEDIRSGKIISNRLVRLAVERHFNDLENAEEKGFYFSEKAARKALRYYDFLTLSKGISKYDVPKERINPDGSIKFELEPWQAFIIASLFGWKKISDNKRRFTEAYIAVSKKNGKTTLSSGIANFMLIADNEPGSEVYMAAYTRDQANICFDESTAQIRASRALSSRVNLLKYSVTTKANRCKMVAVSHDANNTEGKNSHCTILDEYHVHKTDAVKDSLQSGMAARTQPLLFIITTAGFNKQGPCFKHQEMCVNMLEGRIELDNVFSMIFRIDEGDDWKDEAVWEKANPNLGVSVQKDYLRRELKKAVQSGTKEVDFKTKHMNLWVDAAETWIPSETWSLGNVGKIEIPKGAVCYTGFDLGQVSDITSLALYFPEYNYMTHRHYVPIDSAKYASRGGIDYLDWINAGHIIAVPGKTMDYDILESDILSLGTEYDFKLVAYDPYNANQLVKNLSDEMGTTYVPKLSPDGQQSGGWETISKLFAHRQGFISLNTPTKLFEEMILNETLKHDGNPVTAWMLANVFIDTDPAGNIKPHKGKSKDKIDGIVAGIMSLSVWNKYGKYLQPMEAGAGVW